MNRKFVIDVSHWDGDVNFNNWINKYNLWATIIKAGGHETKLGRYTDPQYENNYKKAKAAGLHVGVYYYSVSTTVEDAKKDAEHCISLLKNKNFDMPIYLDVEDPRQFKLSARALTDVIKAFCDKLIAAGYYAGLYIQQSAWLNNVIKSELSDYANWIASWRSDWPLSVGDVGMWQQGLINYGSGKIIFYDPNGGYTDLDWCIIDYPTRIKEKWTKQKKEEEPATSTPKEETKKEETKVADDRLTKFCNLMYTACAEWSLGYDQYNRWDIRNGGECDCSSLVIEMAKRAGFDVGSATYTGNMTSNFTARGWVSLAPDLSQAKPGDILLNDTYHTAAVISGYGWNAKIAQASIDERGCATGGAAGDQTGNETNIKNIYTYSRGWTRILRYVGGSSSGVNIKLTVDGSGGPATISAWQQALGTPVDGVISGQLYSSWVYFPAINSVTWERNGSQVVKAIQRKVGADADGFWGPATSKAIQNFLIKSGFDVGPCGADGYFGTDSVKALQRSLNSDKNPWK